MLRNVFVVARRLVNAVCFVIPRGRGERPTLVIPSLFAFIWKQQAATFPQVHFIQKEAPKPGRWLHQTRLGSSHLIYYAASPQRGGGPQETQGIGQQSCQSVDTTRLAARPPKHFISYTTRRGEVNAGLSPADYLFHKWHEHKFVSKRVILSISKFSTSCFFVLALGHASASFAKLLFH